ncbi:MAG: PTS sugar transporter subunit IIA [Gemmatimonadetes bacterium]|nr:PTS sugar transporter subunit IIA [Gemmatimonadota bacterium]
MKLIEFLSDTEIKLDLEATEKDAALRELVELLELEDEAQEILIRLLRKRENLGSTGIGKRVAIPHCRSLMVDRLRVAYGRKAKGLPFDAIDDKPVHHLFLIVAPPVEISNQYLPVLGRIAQLCKDPENLSALDDVGSSKEFLQVLERTGI